MSYPRDLDEFTTEELQEQLVLRATRLKDGKCDYCGQPGDMPFCRFQDRHLAARRVVEQREADWKASVENTPREW